MHIVGISDADSRVLIKKSDWHIGFELGWLYIANKCKNDALFLSYWIGLNAFSPDEGRVLIIEQCSNAAVIKIKGKGMVPTGDRVIGIADWPDGETCPTVAAPIFDRVQLAGTP